MRLERATDGTHKYVAIFSDGKTTKFGASGMKDYTLTGDEERRRLYRIRHKKDLDTKDPRRAGFLSYYILWGESTSIAENLRQYKSRFGDRL
jgi:hypothetical protein